MQFHSKRDKVVNILRQLVKLNYTTRNTYLALIVDFNMYNTKNVIGRSIKKNTTHGESINVKHNLKKILRNLHKSFQKDIFQRFMIFHFVSLIQSYMNNIHF